MNVEIRKIVPVGFFASLGAPVLYVGYTVFINAIAGRTIDILLLFMMFGSAFIFSFVATMGLILIVIGATHLLKLKTVNVPLFSVGGVLGISAIIALRDGFERSLVFAILALTNTAIFMVMTKRKQ